MDLAVGDMVVVPALGVGVVASNEPLEVGEDDVDAYKIELGADEGSYWIPEARVGTQGLRPPVEAEKLDRLWKELTSQTAPKKRANWNQRRRRYDEMLASNDPLQMAALVGELVAVREKKREKKKQTLSFSERRLLEKAERMFAEEIAASTGDTVEDVVAQMHTRLADA